MVIGNEVMSVHSARIWVLITDGVSSRLCSCHDGMATPISTSLFDLHGAAPDGRHLRAYTAWFKPETQKRLSQNPQRQHLLHVSQVLAEAARERAYEGLIVIAAAPIAADLEEALTVETRALVIGKIVRDNAYLETELPCEQREIHD
jgi:hypothetical protein